MMFANKLDELHELLKNPEKFMLQAGGEYELISEMSFLRSLVKYKNYRIIIYGAGVMGEYMECWLRMEGIRIEFILDSDRTKHFQKCGETVIYCPDELMKAREVYMGGVNIWQL